MGVACFTRRLFVLAHSLAGIGVATRPRSPFTHSFESSRRLPCRPPRRTLLTLAIETSCDDTCVALLQKSRSDEGGGARILFHKKATSDNREFGGIHPLRAVESHTEKLAPLVQEALQELPKAAVTAEVGDVASRKLLWVDGQARQKPDFVAVTRGPGMMSSLATGLNTAKGLATAWDVPLLGVNHMQAHALTPRLVSALAKGLQDERTPFFGAAATRDIDHHKPSFPFFSLLVSGGHTILARSLSLNQHEILAEATNIAIGDVMDKCARSIIPASDISPGTSVMYGPMLERFVFPNVQGPEDYEYTPPPHRADEIEVFHSGRGWTLTPPLAGTRTMAYNFSGFYSQVQHVIEDRPYMNVEERQFLGRHVMRLAFEHLASRLVFALRMAPASVGVRTVVVAGGVASNNYLMHILRSMLNARGLGKVEIISPPLALCTDNAVMIAWTGMEMYEAGWRSNMDILPLRKWPVDAQAEGGGILGADGWVNVNHDQKL